MKPLSEEAILAKILADFPPSPDLIVPIGDDAAVAPAFSGNLVTSVDCQVEGVHFDLKYFRPEELGYRAVQVAASDLAAMGAHPRYALLSLGVRRGLSPSFLTRLYQGVGEAMGETGLQLMGGNLSQSPRNFFVDVTVIGEAGDRSVTRSTGKVGEALGVTGPLGWAAAGRLLLARDCPGARKRFPLLVQRALRPKARIEAGLALAQLGVGAMVDISDGLARDSLRLARASGTGLRLESMPLAAELEEGARELKSNSRTLWLGGGEDYELLFSYDPAHTKELDRALGTGWAKVGALVESGEVLVADGREMALGSEGWDHWNALLP